MGKYEKYLEGFLKREEEEEEKELKRWNRENPTKKIGANRLPVKQTTKVTGKSITTTGSNNKTRKTGSTKGTSSSLPVSKNNKGAKEASTKTKAAERSQKNARTAAEKSSKRRATVSTKAKDIAPVKPKKNNNDLAPVKNTSAKTQRATNTSERSKRSTKNLAVQTTKKTVAPERSKRAQEQSTTTFKEFVSGYLDKGGLDEKITAGNVAKTILGTDKKLAKSAVRGVLGGAEHILDMGTFAVAKGAESLGFDGFAEKAYDFEKRNLVDEVKLEEKLLDKMLLGTPFHAANQLARNIDEDRYSVTGPKLDSVVESAGQIGAVIGLQSVGVPWFATTGAVGFGQGATEALQKGATSNEAAAYGAISAGSEILFEKLSGGIKLGGKTLGDHLVKPLVDKISNKTLKTLTKYGLGAAGEGVEEVLTEIATSIGKKLTYEDEKTWRDLLYSEQAMENYLDALIGGVLVSGGLNVGRVGSSLKTGRDYDTGLSDNEQRVLDAEVDKQVKKRQTAQAENKRKHEQDEAVKKAIEEYEAMNLSDEMSEETREMLTEKALKEFEGKELDLDSFKPTKEELNEIRTRAEKDLREGYADISTIEELFMGNNYTKIKELESKIKDLEAKEAKPEEIQAAKNELSQIAIPAYEQMKETLRNDHILNETYKQRKLMDEAYVHEESDTDTEITKELAESANKAKLGNDTRSHNFFKYVSNIANDLGKDGKLKVKFVNNEILGIMKGDKEYASLNEVGDVSKINGCVVPLKDGTEVLLINTDAAEPFNVTTGHEVTHVLETTSQYGKFSELIEEFATEKGIWNEYIENYTNKYKGIIDASTEKGQEQIKREVVAQLFGEYGMTDESFIKNLSVKEPNIFKQIYENIKHMVKMATAGSAEERKLLQAKKMFEKAYREAGRAPEGKPEHNLVVETVSDTKFHLRKDNKGNEYWQIDSEKDIFKGLKTKKEYVDAAYNYLIKNRDNRVTVKDKKGREIQFIRLSAEEFTNSKESQHLYGNEPEIFKMKMRMIPSLQDILLNATVDWHSPDHKNHKLFKEGGFNNYKGRVRIDNVIFKTVVRNGVTKFGDVFYDINLEVDTILPHAKDASEINVSTSSANNIPDNGTKVNASDNGTVSKCSLASWNNTDKAKVADSLFSAGYAKESVEKWIEDVNGIAAIIAEDRGRLDYEAASNQSMLKKNQEYVRTLDSSTLCAKRLLFQGTYDAIQHAMPGKALLADDVIKLRRMMDEEGYEVPCGICYVESRRKSLGKFASQWLEEYDGEYIPTLDEVIATDGLEKLRVEHPKTYQDFVKAMKKKGVANPKLVELRTDYRGDIRKLNKRTINKITRIGGLRIQSFSDFETPHLIDMMQAVLDMSAKRLTAQAYTKVPNFAWVFGNTGIKINLSLIGDVDADGNLTFDGKEGMKIEDAMALRAAYSENVGTILVGKNRKHILAAMADDRIDFIIPFHRSGWGSAEYEKLGLQGYQDFTYEQTEKNLDGTKRADGSLYSIDYWDFSKSGKENAEKYLELCKEQGRIPVFSSFLVNNGDGSWSLQPDGSTDGYWKMLIDYKMYDNNGVGSPQRKVTPAFNMEQARRVLDEYEGGANKLPVAQDIVDKFVSQYSLAKRDDLAPLGEYNQILPAGSYEVRGRNATSKSVMDDIAPIGKKAEEKPAADDIAPVKNIDNEVAEADPSMFEPWPEEPAAEIEGVEDAEAYHNYVESMAPDQDNTQQKNTNRRLTRKEVHAGYMQKVKDAFTEKGMDFESVLANGKNLSTFATVDNTPQRVMEKTFGYKEGQLLSDLTVNQAAENETEAIRWLNSFTNKKNGVLAKLSKKYNIKPFSKEDAAAQKYAEGMYVNQYGDYVEYGDAELAQEFPGDPQTRANIKAFVADPQLRQIYDETLNAINESRMRNGYPEIPRRKDYFLHFREMDDTFSRIGIPFNPNDIKAKDLPTDINGMTADNKPGQPWFGSQMQRKGVGTTYSLLGGMEKYLTAAKPQIFHIDDIQILRALRNSIADTYGQAKGLENLDELTDEEAEAKIEQVYGAHLSTFAKFLNEEANIMAGKTALIDRGLEGVLGRRAVSFMNTLNSQVAKNMIGFNVSSSLTNFVSVTQAAAKASKYDVIKAFAQTTSNKLKSIRGNGDGFAEKNSAIVRRKGQDKFYKKPWEKISDTGFIFMSAIDDISTEFIVRTKYNELTRKGISEEQAHDEAGKWAMRILGDRSFGQMPQIFNSKTLGLVTKFQLEVRNQLDSMFYDTVQEANVSTEDIKNETAKNAVKAAKITSTVVQLAVFQHLFGKAFESVAGYNPTFDIIENLMILFGFDDDEDDEDTFGDNLEQALLGLGEDLPYFGALTGGRIPIEAALPIEQLVQGKDDYGNDKPRLKTIGEALPYYLLPTGANQIKKTTGGLKMFDKDLPISGSYTDKGNLRFPVEKTPKNIAQAALFGQWANENAQEYFDGEHQPLKEKQIQEFKDLDLPISDYWKIREGMSGKKKAEEKLDYIDSLDLPISKKNILANNSLKRKEQVDMTDYGDFASLEEMDFAVKNPEKYSFSKAVGGYSSYKTYNKALDNIHADKDSDGDSIRGSRKTKVAEYINGLDADYGTKIILYKREYPSDDTYNYEIIDYLNNRDDITYDEMVQILEELDFTVDADGNVRW